VSAIQSYEIQCLDVNLLKEVWQEFETLADALKSNPGSPSTYSLSDSKPRLFNGQRCLKKPPLMKMLSHIFMPSLFLVLLYRVPQFLALYKTLHHINCQTVEKKNHMQNKTFHRGSQKGGKEIKLYCAGYGKRKQKDVCQI
ncbi:hypothetical protein QZH41_018116, partial [Actinostola sp. cb2023]